MSDLLLRRASGWSVPLLAALMAGNSSGANTGKESVATTLGNSAVNFSIAQTSDEQQKIIVRLIAQLGSDQYLMREAAQEALSQIGPEAFDLLTKAESDEDVEISARAKYLVQLIRIDLLSDSDSPQVKKLLQNYDLQPESARLRTLQRLAMLPREVCVPPLCRLVRFERSSRLSKLAALLVINQPDLPDR